VAQYLFGQDAAGTYLGHDNLSTWVLVRAKPAKFDQVMTALAVTADPEFPEEVAVDKSTEAPEARQAPIT